MAAISLRTRRGTDTCSQDTLETSLFAPRLFPTADGPANRYPAPLLIFVLGKIAAMGRCYINGLH
jgi:hypothetical protein